MADVSGLGAQHDAPAPSQAQTGRQLPPSVRLAIRSSWGLVGLVVVTIVLMALMRDAVLGSWASRHPLAREAFANGGRAGLERAQITPPGFLAVGITMLVVATMLVWVLTAFLREGHRWAQLGLTGLALAAVLASVILGLRLHPPTVFVVVAVVSLVLEAVWIVFLWHRDTLRYLSSAWLDGPA
jgi:hypothetical protein